jgi:hypothetical protein
MRIFYLGAFLSDFVSCGIVSHANHGTSSAGILIAFYSKHSHTRPVYETWTDNKLSSYKPTLTGMCYMDLLLHQFRVVESRLPVRKTYHLVFLG